jgi:hypothetical protein
MAPICKIIVVVLYEETVNRYLGMAFYGGVFVEDKVRIRDLNHEKMAPFSLEATMDLA